MRWILPNIQSDQVRKTMDQNQVPESIAKVMVARKLTDIHQTKEFFSPNIAHLHDPFLMKGMEKAVNRIIQNIESKTPIFIFGDYDVDGTTAASLLFVGLTNLGAKAKTYIPNREKEGYGVSEMGIDKAGKFGANLFITCDCGINALNRINYANEKGIDVIITDHHIPGKILPNAFSILNPKQVDCDYPFKELCGGGVALKLITGLVNKMGYSFDIITDLMDLVALGTSADLVPMKNENRVFVHYGLKTLRTTRRLGLRELLKVAKVDIERDLSVTQVVFHVAPRINAAGRLGDANRSVELLTTTDSNIAYKLAQELDQENLSRRAIQQGVVDDALFLVNSEVDLENDKAIVLGSRGWHQGVVGIVASKIKEEFNRPSIIISFDEEGNGKGSARSIKGLDLYSALAATSQHLENYGGHAMAAGLAIHESKFNDFRKAFLSYSDSVLNENHLEPKLYLDSEIKLSDLNHRFMDFLNKLSPFGPGNMRPKFAVTNAAVIGNPKVIGNGDHIRFQIKQKHTAIDVVGFGLANHYQDLILGSPVDIACVVETNVWRGRESIQLNARDIRLSSTT
jgi:single-stranded-DNA-specific exonuclease